MVQSLVICVQPMRHDYTAYCDIQPYLFGGGCSDGPPG